MPTKYWPKYAIVFCLLVSAAFLFLSPPTTAPDELAHLAYPRYVLSTGHIPSFTNPQDFWESHQPPLYYLLSIPITAAFSRLPIFTQLQLNRLTSLALFAASLALLSFTLRKVIPGKEKLRATAIMIAGLPMVCYMAGAFSNDILVFGISCLLLFWLFVGKQNFGNKEAIFFGLTLAAGILTKVLIYPLLLVVYPFVLWKKPLRHWLISGGVAFAATWWWFLHNLQSAGDLFGLSHAKELWAFQDVPLDSVSAVLTMLEKLFSSFWGVFGKLNIAFPQVVYGVLLVCSMAFLAYSLFFLRKNPEIQKLWVGIVAVFGFVFYQNFTFYQPQGRYLIALAPIIAFLFVLIYQKSPLTKTKRVLIPALLVSLAGLQIFSIYLVVHYFEIHPVEALQSQQTISISGASLHGDTHALQNETSGFRLPIPATVYTLADMRLDSQKHPTIHMEIEPVADLTMRIYWKRLGDTNFSVERSFLVTPEQAIITAELPIKKPSLIQDIQVKFQGGHGSILVHTFTISTYETP